MRMRSLGIGKLYRCLRATDECPAKGGAKPEEDDDVVELELELELL
jgi:hypothetical protein